MNVTPLLTVLTLATSCATLPNAMAAGKAGPVAPTAMTVSLPANLQPVGNATMRFLGWNIYQASLWAAPDFNPQRYADYPLALELTYSRSFKGKAIAERSLEEMRRIGRVTPEQEEKWQQALAEILPDVQEGDKILGLHQPGQGAVFMQSGRPLGSIRDSEFSNLFFGIWLSEKTSEPALRQSLLALGKPAAN